MNVAQGFLTFWKLSLRVFGIPQKWGVYSGSEMYSPPRRVRKELENQLFHGSGNFPQQTSDYQTYVIILTPLSFLLMEIRINMALVWFQYLCSSSNGMDGQQVWPQIGSRKLVRILWCQNYSPVYFVPYESFYARETTHPPSKETPRGNIMECTIQGSSAFNSTSDNITPPWREHTSHKRPS